MRDAHTAKETVPITQRGRDGSGHGCWRNDCAARGQRRAWLLILVQYAVHLFRAGVYAALHVCADLLRVYVDFNASVAGRRRSRGRYMIPIEVPADDQECHESGAEKGKQVSHGFLVYRVEWAVQRPSLARPYRDAHTMPRSVASSAVARHDRSVKLNRA